LAINSLQIS